ncbi:MAG: hypothetical protein JNL79_11975 [Myxococcales bacterium]|nr:hypothetical protein [Myxococcales bacterium]
MHPAQMEDLVRRLVADPGDQAALGAAYQAGQQDPRGYATILERVGDSTPDAAYAAHWLSEAAQVWSTSLADPRRAATLLMKAIEKDPASDTAADRLATLYREKNDVRALVALHERRAKALSARLPSDPSVAQRLSLLYEDLGRMWQDAPLSQPKKAVENYKKAFEVDPGAVAAVYTARELLKSIGDWKEALPLYDAEIRAIDDTERRIALLKDEAALRSANGDAKGATGTLRKVLSYDPNDTSLQYELALSITGRIAAGEKVDDEERGEAAELLVAMASMYDGENALAYSEAALDAMPGHERAMQLAAHYAGQTGADVSARWQAYLDANPDGLMAADGRKTLASSLEGQGQLEAAIRVLQPMRDDPEVSARLSDLYARTGNTTELATQMERQAGALPPSERLHKLVELAGLLAQKNDKKGALAKYQEVLTQDPTHPEALGYVEDALRASRNYKELRDFLLAAARVGGAPIDSRRAQLREAANLSESQLKDPEGAIAAYRQLLSIDRTDDSARAALTRLYEKGQRWDDLASLIEQEAMAAGDVEEQIALEKKLADIHEKKRGDKREAAEALFRVVVHAPRDEAALARGIDLMVEAGDPTRAAAALDESVGGLEAGPGKGKLLARLGELKSELGDPTSAADVFTEAAELLHDPALWQRAEQAAVQAERFEQAAAAVGRRGDLERDKNAQAKLRAVEADYLFRAGDTTSSIQRLEQATELAPEDDELAQRLEAAFEQDGRLDEISAFLVRRSEQIADPTTAIDLLRRAARLERDQLNDPDAARALLLRIVERSEDEVALLELAEDAQGREEHEAALGYLSRLEPLARSTEAKVRLLLRQAGVLSDGLGDVDAALVRYRTVLERHDEGCREALQAIADLEQAREHFPEAADALERDLELAAPGEEKANIARRLGEIYKDHTRELGKSLAAFETVIREDTEDFAALETLRELSERAEKWPRVIELLDQQIEVEGDDDEIAMLTARKAQILADQLHQVEDALRVLAPLTAAGSDVARAKAIEIADKHEAHAQIGGQILAWARQAGGPEGQRLLGEAYDRFMLGEDLDRALEIAPDLLRTPRGKDPQFLAQLEPLAVSAHQAGIAGANDLVLEIQDRRASIVSGAARAEELVRQARIRLLIGTSADEAIGHGEIGLGAVPPSESWELVAELAAMAPTKLGAVDLYERHIGRCKPPPDRLQAVVRAYGAAISRAVEKGPEQQALREKAQELAEQALGLAGGEDPFEALYATAREVDQETGSDAFRRALVDLLGTTTAGPRDGGRTRSAQLRRAAEKIRDDIGDGKRAFALLTRALVAHVDDANLDAVEAAAGDDPRRAEAILGKALEEVFDGPLVRKLISRRATLRLDRIGDLDGALRDLDKLHELAPSDKDITARYEALLEQANDYRALVKLYEDQILRSKEPAVRADLARKVALLWEERLGEAREAADAWRRVLRLKPQDPQATEGLDRAKRNKLAFEPGRYPAQREEPPPPPPANYDDLSLDPADAVAEAREAHEEEHDDFAHVDEDGTHEVTVAGANAHDASSTEPPNDGVETSAPALLGEAPVATGEIPDGTVEMHAFSGTSTDENRVLPSLAEDDPDDLKTFIGNSAELAAQVEDSGRLVTPISTPHPTDLAAAAPSEGTLRAASPTTPPAPPAVALPPSRPPSLPPSRPPSLPSSRPPVPRSTPPIAPTPIAQASADASAELVADDDVAEVVDDDVAEVIDDDVAEVIDDDDVLATGEHAQKPKP